MITILSIIFFIIGAILFMHNTPIRRSQQAHTRKGWREATNIERTGLVMMILSVVGFAYVIGALFINIVMWTWVNMP